MAVFHWNREEAEEVKGEQLLRLVLLGQVLEELEELEVQELVLEVEPLGRWVEQAHTPLALVLQGVVLPCQDFGAEPVRSENLLPATSA